MSTLDRSPAGRGGKLPQMVTPASVHTEPKTTGDLEIPQVRAWRWRSHADPPMQRLLVKVESGCLMIVGLIAVVILSGWLFPSVDPMLPRGWILMKSNTALFLLFSALGLALSQFRRSRLMLAISQLLALIVLLGALSVEVEYIFHVSTGFDTLLAADHESRLPGRMSPQTALALVLLAMIIPLIRARKRPAVYVLDFLSFSLYPFVLVIITGYAFGAMYWFGVSSGTRTAPHTMLALMLLASAVFMRRMEHGFLSILVGPGIGGKIARISAPLTLLVPFALDAGRLSVTQMQLMSPEYSLALMTALVAVMGFVLILVFAWRIDNLEQDIRDLSLRDDLTGLYNRRGFLLLATRELRQANRAEQPFSVLFFDLDNLKEVNDTQGHDVGSEFLVEMAGLLRKCFRDSDVIGRIGGDEFVVAGQSSESGISAASCRLQEAAADRNSQSAHPYHLSFSQGQITSDPTRPESLEDMLNRADTAMYAIKREKKLLLRAPPGRA